MGPLHLAIVLGCVALISAQMPGKCPEVKSIEKFEVDKYIGLWYDIQRYPGVTAFGGKCESDRYNKLDDGTVEVISRMCILDNKIKIVGSAKEESSNSAKDGKFSVNFPVMGKDTKSPYHVLDTDYDGYAIVYSCLDTTTNPDSHMQTIRVLGKQTTLNEKQQKAVTDKLKELKLDTLKLTNANQKECCYDATKSDENSAASVGLSMALLLSTVMVRFL